MNSIIVISKIIISNIIIISISSISSIIIVSRTSLGTKVHPKHADMLTSIVVDGVLAVR